MRAMAEDQATGDTAPTKSGGGLGKTLGLGVVLIVAVIAGQLGTIIVAKNLLPNLMYPDWMLAMAPEPEVEETPPAPPAPPLYTRINPSLVVSFQSGSSVRFLQVTLEAMARDQAAVEAFELHSPRIRNDLLLLFASKSLDGLATREGQEMVRKEALEAVKAIIAKESPGGPNIEDLYFTSFVVQ
jgi:flagellar protein FliL